MDGTVAGVIFVEQKVLIQFSEVQHLTHLDASKQVLLLVQLYNCVKSFEVHIKNPDVIPEHTVIKDFFKQLSAIIASCQDESVDATVITPKTEQLNEELSDNDDPETMQEDVTVITIPKMELLNDDLMDNDSTEPVEGLSEDGVLEQSEKKDELSTTSVPGSSTSTITQLSRGCTRSNLKLTIASEKSKMYKRKSTSTITQLSRGCTRSNLKLTIASEKSKMYKRKSELTTTDSCTVTATVQPGLGGMSPYNSDGSQFDCSINAEVLHKKKVDEKTKTVVSEIRRSSRCPRTPVKLNSEEFVGLCDKRSKSVKKEAPKSLKHSETESPKKLKTSPAQKASPKTLKKASVKPMRQKQIVASLKKKNAQKSLEHSAVKRDAPLSTEENEVSLRTRAVQRLEKHNAVTVLRNLQEKSEENDAEIEVEKDVLNSVEEREGTSQCVQEPVEGIISDVTCTEITKAELFEEENKDNSNEESENLHSTDSPYVCAVCNSQFGELGQYIDHIIRHPEMKRDPECVECGIHLKTKSALIQHLRVHQPKLASDVTCPTCGRTFRKKKYLKSHILRHIGEKNILCDLCPATFYDRKGLYVHYNSVHLGKRVEPKFFCTQCEFRSHRKRDMDRHKVVHTKTKNYICDICGARLAHFTSVAIHKRLHSGNKLFRCSTCNKEFSQKISLQNHERVHSGERPFKCDICHRGFQTASHLSRHKITHSQELLFQCKSCDRRFARPFQLKKHVREMHTELPLQNCPVHVREMHTELPLQNCPVNVREMHTELPLQNCPVQVREMHTELPLQNCPVEYECVKIEISSDQVSLQEEPMSDIEIKYEPVVIQYID